MKLVSRGSISSQSIATLQTAACTFGHSSRSMSGYGVPGEATSKLAAKASSAPDMVYLPFTARTMIENHSMVRNRRSARTGLIRDKHENESASDGTLRKGKSQMARRRFRSITRTRAVVQICFQVNPDID